MEKYVIALFLGGGSAFDLRKREIPAAFLGIFAVLGVAVQIWTMLAGTGGQGGGISENLSWIAGGAAGFLLLGAARLTRQAIGYGDALTAMVLGIWLGIIPLMEILFLGLVLAAVYSAWLFLVKKTGGKYRVVFIPFLTAGYFIWLLFAGKGVF